MPPRPANQRQPENRPPRASPAETPRDIMNTLVWTLNRQQTRPWLFHLAQPIERDFNRWSRPQFLSILQEPHSLDAVEYRTHLDASWFAVVGPFVVPTRWPVNPVDEWVAEMGTLPAVKFFMEQHHFHPVQEAGMMVDLFAPWHAKTESAWVTGGQRADRIWYDEALYDEALQAERNMANLPRVTWSPSQVEHVLDRIGGTTRYRDTNTPIHCGRHSELVVEPTRNWMCYRCVVCAATLPEGETTWIEPRHPNAGGNHDPRTCTCQTCTQNRRIRVTPVGVNAAGSPVQDPLGTPNPNITFRSPGAFDPNRQIGEFQRELERYQPNLHRQEMYNDYIDNLNASVEHALFLPRHQGELNADYTSRLLAAENAARMGVPVVVNRSASEQRAYLAARHVDVSILSDREVATLYPRYVEQESIASSPSPANATIDVMRMCLTAWGFNRNSVLALEPEQVRREYTQVWNSVHNPRQSAFRAEYEVRGGWR